MKSVLSFLGIILIAILILAVGSGLLILLAYGVGWVVSLLLDLQPFQATALGLAGIFVFTILLDRIVHALTPLSTPIHDFDLDDDFEDEDESDDYDIFEEDEELDKMYAGIPRWRRPLKPLDFSNLEANDRCPCGSGRKYKNCHGSKKVKI